jgi:alanyl-tRNA synthetase
MGRLTTLTEEERNKIVEAYKITDNLTKICEMTGLPYNKIYNYTKRLTKDASKIVNRKENLAVKMVEQTFDAYHILNEKIQEIEAFIKQMKDENGKVIETKSKDFLFAWRGITDTLQWWIDRKLKMKEMIETELFRAAVLDSIDKEFPTVARRIKEIIDTKRRELNI